MMLPLLPPRSNAGPRSSNECRDDSELCAVIQFQGLAYPVLVLGEEIRGSDLLPAFAGGVDLSLPRGEVELQLFEGTCANTG